MGAALSELIRVTKDILHWLNNPWGYCGVIFSSIFILIYQCIQNPEGAVNSFMILLIDMIVGQFPETPAEYKLGTLLSNFYGQVPWLPGSQLTEIFQGIAGMLSIFLFIKLWKLLPFT